jgi:cyclopropane fatty-acyl-phospholipid synthase-like methyltransferase
MPSKLTLLKYAKAEHRDIVIKVKPDKNAIEFLNSIRPCRLLDIGCGQGLEAMYAASNGFSVTGVDSDYNSIKAAKEAAQKAGNVEGSAEFKYNNFFSFAKSAQKDGFEAVVDNCFSHCLRRSVTEKYYHWLARLLKHNGNAYIKVYSDKDKYCVEHCPVRKWTTVKGVYYYFFSKEELHTIVRKYGFEIVSSSQSEEDGRTYYIIYARLKMTKL